MLLLIDKPKDMTSHDVVNRIRKITGERRVGHGGTLDPNATGLLIVGVGRGGTKQLGKFTKDNDKVYEAEITLGEERSTDDSEGEIINIGHPAKQITEKDVMKVLETFVGEQEQVPPIFSAIKKMGQKAYELARKGKLVELDPRMITVHKAELLYFKYPIIKAKFKVSSGTYIRALARDMGKKLGTYGYLSNLRRTKIGKYSVKKAVNLDRLENSNWREYIIDTAK